MNLRFKYLIVAFALGGLLSSRAWADAAPAPDEAAALAEKLGYSKALYQVEFSWAERTRRAPETLVTGLRLRPRSGGEAIEVYEQGGHALDADARRRLGIRTKTWGPADRSAPMKSRTQKAAPAPAVTPAALRYGLKPKYAIALAPPDRKRLQIEDELGIAPAKTTNRIGVYLDLPEPIAIVNGKPSIGAWYKTGDGGAWWGIEIASHGALGLRLSLDQLELPEGAYAIVYSALDPSQAFGPYAGIAAADNVLWSPTCEGDTAVLECYLPPNAELERVHLRFARAGYYYRDPMTEKIAGSCNLDFACYATYGELGKAVCGIGVIGQAGMLFCTGTLLADNASCSNVDYFLTANHCVGNQFGARGAEYLEFYWLYQNAACNGSPPSIFSVPRTTGGADYLAGSVGRGDTGGGNDFSFLRLHNPPPASIPGAGWTASVPALGTAMTGIHHPSGDYKRISFGSTTDAANLFPSSFHEVTWSQGVTEPGSSGSPVFLDASQKIIGQLWGGGSACGPPSAQFDPDYYGRFDKTYPIVADYLDPDSFEIGFANTNYLTIASVTTLNVSITIDLPSAGGLSVAYATQTGTAHDGVDFTGVSGVATFDEGEDSLTVPIPILLPDSHYRPPRTFTIALSNPIPSCATLSASKSVATISIGVLDSDGDRVSNADESSGFYGAITNPNDPDTDDDGLNDGQEITAYQTNPALPDTDGDGHSDGLEIQLGLDPNSNSDAHALGALSVPWFQ